MFPISPFKAVITDDNQKEHTYCITDCALSLNSKAQEVLLSLYHQGGVIKYKIRPDSRTRDVVDIGKFLTKELDAAVAGSKFFEISEYLERNYIYVGSSDDVVRQFTATRV